MRRSTPSDASGAIALQARDERFEPVVDQLRLEAGAQSWVARQRVGVEAARDRAQVEPGPAGQDRDAAGTVDPGQGVARMGREVGHAERLVGVDEVEAVMGDPRPIRRAGLGRADVEAAEDLARVGRDDGRRAARSR